MDRKEYWNKEYTKYWKEVTDEAEQGQGGISKIKKISGKDYKTSNTEVITSYFDEISFASSDKVLDFGCGLGRFYPYLSKKSNYYGIDISQTMIDSCTRMFPEAKDRFKVAEGESLPFEDNFFDRVICYAVFDACHQEQALAEMFRVVKRGGIILVTGKNDNYLFDDEEAYIAEVNARAKGHPNYFTDVSLMKSQIIKSGGGTVIKENYALRRGDLAVKKCMDQMPAEFYEWILVIKKELDKRVVFEQFSDAYSKTFRRKNPNCYY